MKREKYETPEMKTISFVTENVLIASPTEDPTYPEIPMQQN